MPALQHQGPGLGLSPDLGLCRGASDGNRTRTISLGICAVRAVMRPGLRARCPRVTVRDRSSPGLMACLGWPRWPRTAAQPELIPVHHTGDQCPAGQDVRQIQVVGDVVGWRQPQPPDRLRPAPHPRAHKTGRRASPGGSPRSDRRRHQPQRRKWFSGCPLAIWPHPREPGDGPARGQGLVIAQRLRRQNTRRQRHARNMINFG